MNIERFCGRLAVPDREVLVIGLTCRKATELWRYFFQMLVQIEREKSKVTVSSRKTDPQATGKTVSDAKELLRFGDWKRLKKHAIKKREGS